MLYYPVEEFGIDMFGQRVTGVSGLQTREGFDICLCCRLQLSVAQPLGHILVGHAHQLTERRQVPIVRLQKKEQVSIITQRGQTRCQLRKCRFPHLDSFTKCQLLFLERIQHPSDFPS